MSNAIPLAAQIRERAGKGAARATRKEGRVPAVIYGAKKPSTMISLDPQDLRQQLRGGGFFSHVFEIETGGAKEKVLARDIQLHPVTDRPLHVDFMRLTAGAKVHVMVPVEFENELASPGLKRGGVLNIVRHEIDMVCSPESIPEKLVVDLTGLEIGDSLHISAVGLPDGVTPAAEHDFTVATVVAPSAVKSAETEEGEGEGEGEEAAAEEGGEE